MSTAVGEQSLQQMKNDSDRISVKQFLVNLN